MKPAELLFGLYPVLPTPFGADENIDEAGFRAVIRNNLEAGVEGLMFPGFASEFHKLRNGERLELAQALLEETSGDVSTAAVLSVPDHSTRVAQESAEKYVEMGADCINILPPFFMSPPQAQIVQHLSSVMGAIANTPVIVQLAPAQTGSSLSVEDFKDLQQRHPNFVGIKVESVPPGPVVSKIKEHLPEVKCLVGYAGIHMMDALDRGAHGVQPGASFTALYRHIFQLLAAGETVTADLFHSRMLSYLSYWMTSPELIVQVEKRIGFLRGLHATDVCRRPGRPLDEWESRSAGRFIAEFSPYL